ncbi:hypothetical protein PR048_032350 [Dryococelus australis]|uniref:Uncharacterized protein n=1 Tax=Dryococelus australis TaxID=614101 RepID=A0ABQ9G362_9NEOP|nr:hypothetical protein PR048_032350 [Dryococelus australis]
MQFGIAAPNISSTFNIKLHRSISKGSKNMFTLSENWEASFAVSTRITWKFLCHPRCESTRQHGSCARKGDVRFGACEAFALAGAFASSTLDKSMDRPQREPTCTWCVSRPGWTTSYGRPLPEITDPNYYPTKPSANPERGVTPERASVAVHRGRRTASRGDSTSYPLAVYASVVCEQFVYVKGLHQSPLSLLSMVSHSHLDPPSEKLLPDIFRHDLSICDNSLLVISDAVMKYDGNTARLARRSDEALEVRVCVALIAPSLLDLGRAAPSHSFVCTMRRNIREVELQQGFRIVSNREWTTVKTVPQLMVTATPYIRIRKLYLIEVVEKREITEKIHRPVASSGTISTYENPGGDPHGKSNSGSPWWEASSLTTRPPRGMSPRHLKMARVYCGSAARSYLRWSLPTSIQVPETSLKAKQWNAYYLSSATVPITGAVAPREVNPFLRVTRGFRKGGGVGRGHAQGGRTLPPPPSPKKKEFHIRVREKGLPTLYKLVSFAESLGGTGAGRIRVVFSLRLRRGARNASTLGVRTSSMATSANMGRCRSHPAPSFNSCACPEPAPRRRRGVADGRKQNVHILGHQWRLFHRRKYLFPQTGATSDEPNPQVTTRHTLELRVPSAGQAVVLFASSSPTFPPWKVDEIRRYDGNAARLARRSDEALKVRVSVARIAPSLPDRGHRCPSHREKIDILVRPLTLLRPHLGLFCYELEGNRVKYRVSEHLASRKAKGHPPLPLVCDGQPFAPVLRLRTGFGLAARCSSGSSAERVLWRVIPNVESLNGICRISLDSNIECKIFVVGIPRIKNGTDTGTPLPRPGLAAPTSWLEPQLAAPVADCTLGSLHGSFHTSRPTPTCSFAKCLPIGSSCAPRAEFPGRLLVFRRNLARILWGAHDERRGDEQLMSSLHVRLVWSLPRATWVQPMAGLLGRKSATTRSDPMHALWSMSSHRSPVLGVRLASALQAADSQAHCDSPSNQEFRRRGGTESPFIGSTPRIHTTMKILCAGGNPPTSGIVRHDSHVRKSCGGVAGNRRRFSAWREERALVATPTAASRKCEELITSINQQIHGASSRSPVFRPGRSLAGKGAKT